MKRHRNRRNTSTQKLNLVALMDIFTILVFFLMVNSSDVQIKESHESIALPKSETPTLPKNSIKLFVNEKILFLENLNSPIALESSEGAVYPELIAQLQQLAKESDQRLASRENNTLEEVKTTEDKSLTILSDKEVPYSVMKKILASCAQTPYRDIGLAVNLETKQESMETSNLIQSSNQDSTRS